MNKFQHKKTIEKIANTSHEGRNVTYLLSGVAAITPLLAH